MSDNIEGDSNRQPPSHPSTTYTDVTARTARANSGEEMTPPVPNQLENYEMEDRYEVTVLVLASLMLATCLLHAMATSSSRLLHVISFLGTLLLAVYGYQWVIYFSGGLTRRKRANFDYHKECTIAMSTTSSQNRAPLCKPNGADAEHDHANEKTPPDSQKSVANGKTPSSYSDMSDGPSTTTEEDGQQQPTPAATDTVYATKTAKEEDKSDADWEQTTTTVEEKKRRQPSPPSSPSLSSTTKSSPSQSSTQPSSPPMSSPPPEGILVVRCPSPPMVDQENGGNADGGNAAPARRRFDYGTSLSIGLITTVLVTSVNEFLTELLRTTGPG